MLDPQQGEPLYARAVHDSVEVEQEGVQRYLRRFTLRQPCPPNVVPYEPSRLRQALIPAAYIRELPLHLDVTECKRRGHQRHPFPQGPEGDSPAVAGLRVLNARLHSGPILPHHEPEVIPPPPLLSPPASPGPPDGSPPPSSPPASPPGTPPRALAPPPPSGRCPSGRPASAQHR